MKIESSRDMFHNYRILSEGRMPERNSYTIRMLTDNRIPGFLECQIREIDTEMKFLYDVTSMQSLEDMLVTEKISGAFLELLYTSLIHAIKSLEEFLLDEQGILLCPELIFMNADRTALFFIYYPDQELRFSEELKLLGEKLLPHLNHADKQSVIMGYAFYQRTVDGNFSADTFQELLEECQNRKHDREAASGDEAGEQKREQKEQREKLLEEFFSEEDNAEEEGMFARARKWFRRRKQKETRMNSDRIETEEQAELYAVPESGLGDTQEGRLCQERESVHAGVKERQHGSGTVTEQDGGAETMLLAGEKKHGDQRRILARLLPDQKNPDEGSYSRQAGTEGYDLWKPHHILGKSRKSSDLILEVPAVSRIHARFIQKDEGYSVIDMNSKNGTFLNGRMLVSGESCPLHQGDRLRFSDQSFIYQDV